jgi:GPH family glycoside/pentoside/hexuronide:cation symporter
MNKLSTGLKLMYGLGFSAQGIKDGLFQVFLFFYFNQVLGLDPSLSGTAAIIALLFDSVSDPLVGVISDKWKSAKWGRRHPFMFWSAIPLGITTYFLFVPPDGMGQTGLFLWLTSFAILVRLSLTLYLIPGLSLGAELTTDYNERTSVTSYRIMFSSFVGPLVMMIGLILFFAPTEEYVNGLLNPAPYPKFAMLCSILIILLILISTWGTRRIIPSLPTISDKQASSTIFTMFSQFREAFKLKEFSTLISYIGMMYIGIGVGMMLSTYLMTFYFGLSEKELAVLLIGPAMAGILALFVAPFMGKRLGKKKAIIWSTVAFAFFFALPINLRIMGLFPENGSPNLLPLYAVSVIIAYVFLWVAMSISNSMMADVADSYELKTGQSHEGLFFSSLSFAYKCSVGLGSFFAGYLLKIIAFPSQTAISFFNILHSAISNYPRELC